MQICFSAYYILAEAACLRQVRCCYCGVVENGSLFTFSVKPKWRTALFCFYAVCSSAEAYLRTSPPRGHSTLYVLVGVPKRCAGFVAIWLRAREEFTDNHFQLLFIYR